ncbi:MAG: GIY-YIG nuclease family protein [Planctomycetia bacterium]|nr:GIY-YIG nuclease family protein [Planctomycetia bacterium]
MLRMNLNDLLAGTGIDTSEVIVFRHRPNEPELRKVLPWLAAEKPELFNAYQQTHSSRVENAMRGAKYVASFIGHEPAKALFVGLYSIGETRTVTREEFWEIPAYAELKPFGMRGFAEEDDRTSVLWFDLTRTDFYEQWKGKLVVGWPPPERSWWRRAHKNAIPVLAIHEESVLDAGVPQWDEINLTWDELRVLPASWRAKLSEWRAIYYIFDTSAGRGYVGSAYGADNILGRWMNYAASGHGGNRLLRQRSADHFQFSILQRVSPDMHAEDIIRIENSWKSRLHTRAPNGFNEN